MQPRISRSIIISALAPVALVVIVILIFIYLAYR